jgi:CubicO group peptidase (beta-lactamase class C family)
LVAEPSSMKPKIPPSLLLLFIPFGLFSQSAGFEKKIQAKLDSFCVAGKFPGISIGIALPGNNIFAFVSGFADVAKGSKMKTSDCLMQGSVGKTYVPEMKIPLETKMKLFEADGKFIINPQFEWTGGGLYSTSRDLAKWAKIAYEGKAFDPSLLPIMLEGVPSPMLGGNTKYGLGVIIRESQTLGTFYGHSGFFPGYLAEVYYFPKQRFTIALLTNSSDFKSLKIYDLKVLVEIANVVAKGTE